MNTHLTSEELTDLLLGVHTYSMDSHLRVCSDCRRELEQMQESIQSFRSASHAWSEKARASESRKLQLHSVRKPGIVRPWMFAVAAVALLVLVFGIYRMKQPQSEQAHSVTVTPASVAADLSQEQLAQDNELLSQINAEIAEDVPAPMQPLQVTASDAGSSKSQNQ